MINKKSKIFIAGHMGLVGSSIFKYFKKKNYKNLITINKNKLDLLDQRKVLNFFKKKKFDAIILAAAKVGGIKANKENQGDFLYENLQIQNNVIHSAYITKVKRLIFLGSSCIYPKNSPIPIKEKYLLSGGLEKTNEAYAIAKIAGLKLCEFYNKNFNLNYTCLMPCNLYGPNDNYDLQHSHFFPALIRKIHEAKLNKLNEIKIWGNGKPRRELMFVDDLAIACEFFLNKKTQYLLNIGTGKDYSIKYYATFIMKKLNYFPKIKYINKNLNGTLRKVLDVSVAKRNGWNSIYNLDKGFNITYENFKKKNKKKN